MQNSPRSATTQHLPLIDAANLLALAACRPDRATVTDSPLAAAENVCLGEVGAVTNNPEHTVLSSTPLSTDTEVIVGVGPDRAP